MSLFSALFLGTLLEGASGGRALWLGRTPRPLVKKREKKRKKEKLLNPSIPKDLFLEGRFWGAMSFAKRVPFVDKMG